MANAYSTSNKGFTQFEPLLTTKQLFDRYLFGVGIVDGNGNEMPKDAFQSYINFAIGLLEADLDIAVMPRVVTEEKDYSINDYTSWGYIQLNQYPVISIESIKVTYLRDEDGEPETALEIPKSWIRLDKKTGIVRLIPNSKFPSALQIGSSGSFFPEILQHTDVPALWTITYTHGFEDGKVPVLLNTAIGLIASLIALSIAGNLVLGAGIAASSISLDGLSQSISTTQSAENSAYSATRDEYMDQLYGRTEADPFAILKILRHYYKGTSINIV